MVTLINTIEKLNIFLYDKADNEECAYKPSNTIMKWSILIFCILFCSCNKERSISERRVDGIKSDTTLSMAVYGGLSLGSKIDSTNKIFENEIYKNTYAYKLREGVLNEKIYGLRGAWALFNGYNESSGYIATQKDLRVFEEFLKDETKYGSLQIDSYAHLDLYKTNIIIDTDREKSKSLKKDFSGWYTYLENHGVIYSVVCIFDIYYQTESISCEHNFDNIFNGFIELLSDKYGDPMICDIGNYCWLFGKYEIQLSACHNISKSSEVVIKYLDNKAIHDIELLKKQKENNKLDSLNIIENKEQKELKDKHSRQLI